LMAYSWELADRILSVGDGRVVVGKSEGEVVTDHRSVIPLITPNN
jgi:hypothetical protein